MTRRQVWIFVQLAVVAVFFLLPLWRTEVDGVAAPVIGDHRLSVLNDIGLYVILALSLNVILGHAGMFHMGHAAFFAVGAYTSAILNTQCGWPILATLPVAGAAAALVALVVAAPIIHLRGDYLLMVTIGIVEIVRIVVINDPGGLTGGANGIYDIDRLWVIPDGAAARLFGEGYEDVLARLTPHRSYRTTVYYFVIWGAVAASMLMFRWLEVSRFGRALKYIREDAVAAANMGVNVSLHKLLAFVLGALWAGFAGTLFASNMRTVAPGSFTFDESVKLFMIVILGGSGSQRGVLLGAFLVVGLPEAFRDLEQYRMLVFGAALVAMMIFRPQGILPPKPRRYAPEDLPVRPLPTPAPTPADATGGPGA